MTNTDMLPARESNAIEYYEEEVSVRGCILSMENIQQVYQELDKINKEFGKSMVASLTREEGLGDDQWEAKKAFLLSDAFRLTTTIIGNRDQRVYGEDDSIFASKNLPDQIKSIYFTNITAFKRNAGGSVPKNAIEVVLDFGKPDLTDASPLVSEKTPNGSQVSIRADDISFFRAARQVIDTKLTNHRSRFGFLHVNFAYDFGLWLLAFPSVLLLATYYTDLLIPQGSSYEPYRWALFIYCVGIGLLAYRFLNSYARWAFPVNVLVENRDAAWKHRILLGAAATSIALKVLDVLYGLVIG